jgi:hypothetical protein
LSSAAFAIASFAAFGFVSPPPHQGAPSSARPGIWQQVFRRCGAEAAESFPPYPWPIAPVDRQHPVRGYFGDPRTVVTGIGEGAYSFHNGVDISAPTGAHVFPVVSGVVVHVLPDRVVVLSPGPRRFQYIHIRPWVKVGMRVTASETVLGIVDPVFHHVHLSEIRDDCVVNPLAPGHLTPYRDTTRPVIRSILFETLAGRRLSPLELAGAIRVIANAFARPAMASPPPWSDMPVSPALITWKLTTVTGREVRSRIALDFRVGLPPNRDFCAVYAPGTLQNFAAVLERFHWGKPGVYLYDLTPLPFETARLQAGRYRFVVTAATLAGTATSKAVTVVIRHSPAAAPVVVTPPDTRCQPHREFLGRR